MKPSLVDFDSQRNRLYWSIEVSFAAISGLGRYQQRVRMPKNRVGLLKLDREENRFFPISLTLKNTRNYNFLGWGEFFTGLLNS